MTRQKKSRKVGQIGIRKQDARPEAAKPHTKKKKTPKGQKSGNRNSLVIETTSSNSPSTSAKKDPKLGSKKVIPLVVAEHEIVEQKPQPIVHKEPEVKLAKVRPVETTPEQELAALENDQILIALAERVESGEILSGKEAKYFNKNMTRFDELLDILGIEDDIDDEQPDPIEKLGADQWDDLLDS